jgi:hypothetical protein
MENLTPPGWDILRLLAVVAVVFIEWQVLGIVWRKVAK